MDVAPSLESGKCQKVSIELSSPVFLNQRTRLTAIVLRPSKADHQKAGRQTRLEKRFATKKFGFCNINDSLNVQLGQRVGIAQQYDLC